MQIDQLLHKQLINAPSQEPMALMLWIEWVIG
jgi:hypothetical protein